MSKQDRKTVYFLHIRKTAGTSFFKKIKASNDAPKLIGFDGFQTYFTYLRQHKNVDLSDSMIRTHAYYGMHYFNLQHLFNPTKYTYATILRDPIERAISYYYYVRKERKERYQHHAYKLARRVDLKDFYTITRKDNEQTRILSGRHSKMFERCNPWLLETAKKHLSERFSVVGITERFDETVGLFNDQFGWNLDRGLTNAKVNQSRPKQLEIPEETLAALRDAHQFDIELYELATKLFDKQLREAVKIGKN